MTISGSTWREMTRLRELAIEMGKDTDPLQLAVEELTIYNPSWAT
jgi:hypothetical protein